MNSVKTVKRTAGPALAGMSRRTFLLLTGGAVAAAAAADAADAGHGVAEAPKVTALSKNPVRNPGFNARPLPGEGMLVWAGQRARFKAYRMNEDGQAIWRLCDGTRERSAIAAEYASIRKRPEAEAEAFLAELLNLGIVASGGTVAVAGAAPKRG